MAELQNSYPAATHSLPGLSTDDRFSDLESLTSFLNGRGIETKNTRIDRYQRYLKIASDQELESIDPKNIFKNVTDGRFQHGLDWYLYVLREVDELAHILKGLKVHVPVGVDERLRKIVGGSDFAALDKNSESRNIQFELRIASYFCLAGFIVRLDTETDIIASKGRQHFYIECKRISNSKQLEENLLKAKRQILARVPKKKRILHKYYGVIAVDVTRVAYTHNGLTLGITNDHAREVVQSALRSISEKIELIRFFSKKPPIIQCWLQIHIPGLIESPPQAFTRFSSMFTVNPETAISCKAALLLLHNVYAGSDFSDPRESPSRKINTELNLPAGTQLWLSPNISDLMLKASDPGFYKRINESITDDFDDIAKALVGGIVIKGKKYDFSMVDLVACFAKKT
ncbi:hypothetical protein PSE10C_27270 [Pseudomonas amygdali pv. eriobotryae]|nr:hypothetical protein [Pseudomonas amygdali]KWS77231.1 hypothetical protein AL052_03085 [Pseudomonas amygdali pv. eriobotryae]GFZ71985.1 hypothetical protein PSE10C_27270 [Pseudomonas amygdali pv. eriobotryae]